MFELHWFVFDRLVVDREQLFFVENHFFAGSPDNLISRREFDGIAWTRFLAHAAKDTF